MISKLCKKDDDFVLKTCRETPCFGPRIEADWRLTLQNPRLQYQFFATEDGTLVQTSKRGATICKNPKDEEELCLFLKFSGITRLASDGWLPKNWRAQPFVVMQRKASPFCATSLLNFEIDILPSSKLVLHVLESNNGRIVPLSVRDSFYSEICVRRNHGFADVFGVWQGEKLVSTAGAYAITSHEAYIACIETRLLFRGKGFASGLLGALCAKYAHLPLTLLCEDNMAGFYNKFGFEAMQSKAFICHAPKFNI